VKNTLRAIAHLVRADFLERVRRYSFLITLGVTIFAAYSFVPPAGARYATVDLGGYRGVYNSAWIGCTVALVTTLFLALAGFYLVKNAVERDLQTGVGQIIATTPLRKPLYTLGKALSNFAVLAVMVGLIAVASGVMQVVRGEDLRVEPWALLSPFLVLALPAMAVVAALAILFEVIPWLRGGLGNVIYYFLYTGLVVYAAVSSEAAPANAIVPFDVFAFSIPVSRITTAVRAAVPGYNGGFSIGINPVEAPLSTFYWAGIQWTPGIILQRLAWLGVAVAIALGAALFFDRFDPARGRQKRQRGTALPAVPETSVAIAPAAPVRLAPLPTQHKRFYFGRMVLGELRLMLKGQRWWWYVVALGLAIAAASSPLDVVRQYLLPAAWLWPFLVWSPLGNREARHRTEQMVFSAAFPLRGQLPAAWIAGLIVALATGSGVALRLLLAGQWSALLAWAVGAAFIPALALALGVWSGSSKLFEVVYFLLWYAGPMNQVPALDYLGATDEAVTTGIPLVYLALTLLLLGLAFAGRQRQMHKGA